MPYNSNYNISIIKILLLDNNYDSKFAIIYINFTLISTVIKDELKDGFLEFAR